jgi:hypothetical protein
VGAKQPSFEPNRQSAQATSARDKYAECNPRRSVTQISLLRKPISVDTDVKLSRWISTIYGFPFERIVMRTALLLIVFPIAVGYTLAQLVPPFDRGPESQPPQPAAMVFRAGTSQQWFDNDRTYSINAVLRKTPDEDAR